MNDQHIRLCPIAKLAPGSTDEATHVRGVVTLSWPYSALDQTCSFLLAEPDILARAQHGQVKISFVNGAARRVGAAKIPSGRHVLLNLKDAQWIKNESISSTPSRGIDWELRYSSKIHLQIIHAEDNVEQVEYDEDATQSTSDPAESQDPPPTWSSHPFVPDYTLKDSALDSSIPPSSAIHSSPAFLRQRPWLAPIYDPIEDDFPDSRRTKKTRFGRRSSEWKIIDEGSKSESAEQRAAHSQSPVSSLAKSNGIDTRPAVEAAKIGVQERATHVALDTLQEDRNSQDTNLKSQEEELEQQQRPYDVPLNVENERPKDHKSHVSISSAEPSPSSTSSLEGREVVAVPDANHTSQKIFYQDVPEHDASAISLLDQPDHNPKITPAQSNGTRNGHEPAGAQISMESQSESTLPSMNANVTDPVANHAKDQLVQSQEISQKSESESAQVAAQPQSILSNSLESLSYEKGQSSLESINPIVTIDPDDSESTMEETGNISENESDGDSESSGVESVVSQVNGESIWKEHLVQPPGSSMPRDGKESSESSDQDSPIKLDTTNGNDASTDKYLMSGALDHPHSTNISPAEPQDNPPSINTKSKPLQPPSKEGLQTPLSYFPILSTLPSHFGSTVDVLAIVKDTQPLVKAAAGPKDYIQTLSITDPSMHTSAPSPAISSITSRLFRHDRHVLPDPQPGQAILLRDMAVQSTNSQISLISTATSAWAVFSGTNEVVSCGAPVEFGDEEDGYARGLISWWRELK